jgi:hypothetical protein
MAERRANALAARDSSDSATEEAQVEVTEGKQFATAADIPGGARPITGKREAAALSAEQLVEAPDTGFAATSGAGTGGGLVVESSNVIGSGGSTGPSFAQRSRVENGVVVADRMLEAGDVLPAPNSDRGFGPADPTGLPCSCAMGTTTVGRPKAETWCIVCGGELDGKTRPENALKGRRNVSVRAATALSMQDLEVITAAAEERAYQRLLADLKAGGVIKE